MRIGRSISALAVAALLTACETPTGSTPEAATVGPSFAQGNAVVASTSGGGKAQLPPAFSLLSFAFNAALREDGGATGQFRQIYESVSGTVDFQGRVTCVSFDAANGRAWIGGVITRNGSTNPATQGEIHQPGHDAWFRVVDNGEGESPDDRTTVLGFEGGGGIATSE